MIKIIIILTTLPLGVVSSRAMIKGDIYGAILPIVSFIGFLVYALIAQGKEFKNKKLIDKLSRERCLSFLKHISQMEYDFSMGDDVDDDGANELYEIFQKTENNPQKQKQ